MGSIFVARRAGIDDPVNKHRLTTSTAEIRVNGSAGSLTPPLKIHGTDEIELL